VTEGEVVRTKAHPVAGARGSVLESSYVTRNLPLSLGMLCAVVGFTVHGLEGGVLWALVGYFLGKAVQSTIWTFNGSRTT